MHQLIFFEKEYCNVFVCSFDCFFLMNAFEFVDIFLDDVVDNHNVVVVDVFCDLNFFVKNNDFFNEIRIVKNIKNE